MDPTLTMPILQAAPQNAAPAQTFIAHPALYGASPAPPPNPLPIAAQYEKLKGLDQLLDSELGTMAEAKELYQQTLQQFATLCHQLWQQEKAPGSRQGKGFRHRLEDAGINTARAYRAMRRFFPADFPARQKRKASTLIAATKVANRLPILRFTGKLRRGRHTTEAREVLECVFTLTPAEKAEFSECLKLVDAPQVQRLLLDAVKHAADALRN
ncbi:MAG TPA: hypothetical protein VKY85_20155 [Candidatus Angelobacter sp.]|nr:hypothetical protein [Candidatus Angelobacter sp.]